MLLLGKAYKTFLLKINLQPITVKNEACFSTFKEMQMSRASSFMAAQGYAHAWRALWLHGTFGAAFFWNVPSVRPMRLESPFRRVRLVPLFDPPFSRVTRDANGRTTRGNCTEATSRPRFKPLQLRLCPTSFSLVGILNSRINDTSNHDKCLSQTCLLFKVLLKDYFL